METRPVRTQQAARRAAGAAGLALLCLAPDLAAAGTVWLPDGASVSNVPAGSLRETKFAEVVRQQYDFSCGSAALATLLSFHYERPTAEQEAFEAMFAAGDREKIGRAGFSLLDMKHYLESIGFAADGYETTLDTLEQAGVPAIALINDRGYRHFVVVKGIRKDEILIGDPALGMKYMSRQRFESLWDNGVLFIIKNRPEVGRRHFNSAADWSLLARAPLGAALPPDSLAQLAIGLPELGEF